MRYVKLIVSLALPQIAGAIGAVLMGNAVSGWYAGLEKPLLNPPSWVFGPAWIILYLLMGVSSYLVWLKVAQNSSARKAMIVYWAHLAVNAAWTPIFFGLKSPGWAFLDIVILWLMIVSLIILFYKVSKPAAYMLAPYILWVSFAAYLNYAIWILN